METKEVGNELERDTTMCSDPKTWFPMRVTYQREMKVKAELDRLGIENFVPMRYKVVDGDTDNPHRELVPAINNLIFVRSTQELVSELKQKNESPYNYMAEKGRKHEIPNSEATRTLVGVLKNIGYISTFSETAKGIRINKKMK